MKILLLSLAIPFLLSSCRSGINNKEYTQFTFEPFPLEVPEENALMTRWEHKEVLQSKLVDDFEEDGNWDVTGIGEMEYTEERSRDGSRSLRFRTSLRDEEFYKQNRSEWDSFNGGQGGRSFIRLNFDQPQDWTEFNRISFWIYVHPTSMPTYCIHIQMICKDVPSSPLDYNGASHFVQDLKPGEWNHVMFEIPHLQRNKVSSFLIYQMLRGHNPEEEGIVTYDIDQLEIQQVVTDKYEGWEVENDKFSFSHIGYRPADNKKAMAGFDGGNQFEILDGSDQTVYTGKVREVANGQGTFRIMDFSEFTETGTFRLKYNDKVSNPFPVEEDIWISPLFKTINFFFCERCGYHVPGVHLECHKDWQGFHGDQKKIINGGWHDAGDLSQGSWRTAMSTLAMMMNLEHVEKRPELHELSKRIREEIAWGLEWLLKTRFGDGYHISFSMMRIYTDNEVGTIDDVVSPASNVPWENFLAAYVQAKASQVLKNSHPQMAEDAWKAAVKDWSAAYGSRDSWDQADYREASWGATASLLLAEMTGEKQYEAHAVHFGDLLIRCQEQEFLQGIPITGYFYTNTDRESVIHNRHAAFEEAPLIALTSLCRALPEHPDYMKWYVAALLHGEYFMKRGSQISSPYDLLPNSVWSRSEIEEEEDEKRKQIILQQFNEGTFLNEEYVLRTFPIYMDGTFHGNTNIHMSSTWALAETSRLRKDENGMRLVRKQFQWIFGGNPFSQSLMYGEGYDFPPHFAYCLKDLVGALPVGMDCMSGDDPHWSATNNATYKEIWVEPVNRFMGALAIYLSESQGNGELMSPYKESNLKISITKDPGEPEKIEFGLFSDTSLEIRLMHYNLELSEGQDVISVKDGPSGSALIEMRIIDQSKPYVLLARDVNSGLNLGEVTGAQVTMP